MRWLKEYERADLLADFVAGLVVTVVLVPQGMAYALLAGLSPVHGLYASVIPAIVYALFGTSRHMPVGPPALMALLTFASISTIAGPGTKTYLSLALLLALMAGVLQLTIGIFRMGFLANFISRPVLTGFVYASAVVIALSQLDSLLGIAGSGGHSTLQAASEVARGVGSANTTTLAVGLVSIGTLVVLSKVAPRLPGPLLVAVGSTLAVWALGLEGRGVEVVGEVPRGLPNLSVPPLDLAAFRTLLPAAMAVAFVGFVESISVAKAVALREGYKVDSNRELAALGLANASAAFSSGFPVAGSFSRTAVNHQAGAKTQLASVFAALAIVVVLLFLTPLFYHLPYAALAAIIMVAVWRLIDLEEARRAFRISKLDGYALVFTFALTLLLGIEEGILGGTVFSLLAFVRSTTYPDVAELGYVEERDAFLGLRSHPQAKAYPGVLIFRFDAPLYYANVPYLEEWLLNATAVKPNLRYVVMDCRGVDTVDATAVEGLEGLVGEYRSSGVGYVFTHAKLPVRERFERAGWGEKFGDIASYPTTRDALGAMGLLKDRSTAQSAVRCGPKRA